MTILNYCVKNPDPMVKYLIPAPVQFDEDVIILSDHVNTVNFHIPTLIEEVRELPKQERKSFRRICKSLIATTSSFLMLSPLKSMAATSIPTTTVLPNQAEGMPPELLKMLITLLVISVGTAVVLSVILMVGAGVMRMFRQRKEANEWTVDIIKGLIQILVAAPVVFLIYYLANLLFSGSGWHISPF